MKAKPTWRELLIGVLAIAGTFFGFQLVPDPEPPAPEVVVDTVYVQPPADSAADSLP